MFYQINTKSSGTVSLLCGGIMVEYLHQDDFQFLLKLCENSDTTSSNSFNLSLILTTTKACTTQLRQGFFVKWSRGLLANNPSRMKGQFLHTIMMLDKC